MELENFGTWIITVIKVFDGDTNRVYAGSSERKARWYNVRESGKGKYIMYRGRRLYFTKWEGI